MAILQDLIPGGQNDIWGDILEGNLVALNTELVETTAKANAAVTPAMLTSAINGVVGAGAVLGTSENPIADAAAARPNLPAVWWATGTTVPTNIATGDFRVQAVAVAAGKVVGVAAADVSSTSANLGWTALAGATAYTVERRVKGDTAWIATNGVTSTNTTFTGLNVATIYEVRVTGVVNGVAGTPSDVVEFITDAAATVLFTSTDGGSGFSAKTNTTVASGSTEQFKDGAQSLKATAVAAGMGAVASPAVTVGPNRPIVIKAWVYLTTGGTCQLFCDFQTATGQYVSTGAGADRFVSAGVWTELTISVTSPGTSDRVVIAPTVYNLALGAVFYVDSVTVSA